MKKFNSLFILFAAIVIGFTSCVDGNDKPVDPVDPETDDVLVNTNISSNTTWETGKTYVLGGRIAVTAGNTLTIQPGVIVKGEVGSGSNATALIIARGAKIDAQGTATSPIIFTTIADEIMPGEIASPNLEADLSGLWGGLIILGKWPNIRCCGFRNCN